MHHHTTKSSIGFVALLNLIFAISEFLAGFAFNSTALLSDAVHDLGDAFVLILSAVMKKVSQKKPTVNYSYGFGRLNLLTALLNSLILLLGTLFVVREAISKIQAPEPVNSSGMFLMAILGVAINLWAVLRMKGSKNILDRSVMLHLAEDLLGWLAVLVTSIIIHVTNWYILDPLVSLVIALFIFSRVLKNLYQVYQIMMIRTSSSEEMSKLSQAITGLDGVLEMSDSHYWSLDGQTQIFTAKLVIKSDTDTIALRQAIDDLLAPYQIACSTIEFLTSQ